MDSVLIVSYRDDMHVPPVAGYLERWGVPYYVLNVDELSGGKSHLSCSLQPEGSEITAYRTGEPPVDLASFRTVWLRRPYEFKLTHVSAGPERTFAESQVRAGLDGAFHLLGRDKGRRWVNPVSHATGPGNSKANQLVEATRAGLEILPTLVTNDAAAIRRFWDEHSGNVVVKAIGHPGFTPHDGTPVMFYTHRLERDRLPTPESLGGMPVQVQLCADIAYELRVTSIGNHHWAVQHESPKRVGIHDYRLYDSEAISYRSVELPPRIADALTRYKQALGISYCAFDLFVDRSGPIYFGEGNYGGQYLWLEEVTGIPLSESMARWLSRAA